MTDLRLVNAAGNLVTFTDIDTDSTQVYHYSGAMKIVSKRNGNTVITHYSPNAWRSTEIEIEEN